MIVTVTLNPAVDSTFELNELIVGGVNRVQKMRQDVGGKGINVSKQIKELGAETIAVGVLAGRAGAFIREQLDYSGINNHFIEIDGNTRTNIKIVDLKNRTHTDINEQGTSPTMAELVNLENIIFNYAGESGILVLSGSVPQGVDKKIYARWIRLAKEKGLKTVLDAEGELLKAGVKEGPYIVKPNLYEFERLHEVKIDTISRVVDYSKHLLDYGTEIVAVSMGEKGSVYVSRDEVLIAKSVKVDVKSTVGAGDSMVGALTYALSCEMPLEQGARLAVASATASVSNEGTQMGKIEQIKYWMNQIQLIRHEH